MVKIPKGSGPKAGPDHKKREVWIMKKNRSLLCLLTLLCVLLLSACAASAADGETPDASPQAEQTPPAAQETSEEPTLEDLLGEDYVSYLTETITMQMGNRMEKDPDVRYYPIEDNAPLTDYVAIDETTAFEVDEEGNPVILFPAGTVTDEANGEQSFRVPKLYQ